MAQDTVGTLLASSHYVWYGKITAKMTTSQGKGVVTAFIMMSDVKDEIDFEFIGVDINHAQSNFYSQGVTNYNNGMNLTVDSDTVNNEHEYVIDWQPDTLTWSIDGNVMRTLNRKDTWNSTSGRFDYPQTPSRVMLSLWPAGLPSNAEGTINWAGGLVDWNSQYMQNGYYYAHFSSIEVECYDPPSGANKEGSKTYIYNNEAGTNDTVVISDKQIILGSLQATGEDPNKGKASSSSASAGTSKTSSAASASSTAAAPESVPGMSGGGNRGDTDFLAVVAEPDRGTPAEEYPRSKTTRRPSCAVDMQHAPRRALSVGRALVPCAPAYSVFLLSVSRFGVVSGTMSMIPPGRSLGLKRHFGHFWFDALACRGCIIGSFSY
ncbi:Glycoside hydrolase family 16 [Macrophomina phaseolina MS6]|uniref:Glycoside hydrolase family 16 n=1 Tax=Macrophomina phaseolina (strain MS6) TaxID=1126212 RepID=K2RK33_MACPH|nr:Glycoside hydrolase family 16 [Macrophomina phaseolina MS6]